MTLLTPATHGPDVIFDGATFVAYAHSTRLEAYENSQDAWNAARAAAFAPAAPVAAETPDQDDDQPKPIIVKQMPYEMQYHCGRACITIEPDEDIETLRDMAHIFTHPDIQALIAVPSPESSPEPSPEPSPVVVTYDHGDDNPAYTWTNYACGRVLLMVEGTPTDRPFELCGCSTVETPADLRDLATLLAYPAVQGVMGTPLPPVREDAALPDVAHTRIEECDVYACGDTVELWVGDEPEYHPSLTFPNDFGTWEDVRRLYAVLSQPAILRLMGVTPAQTRATELA